MESANHLPARPIHAPLQAARATRAIVSARHLVQTTIAQRLNTTAPLHRVAAIRATTLRAAHHHRVVAATQAVRAAAAAAVEEAVVAEVAVKGTFNPTKVFF